MTMPQLNASRVGVATVRAPATCGELAQGVLEGRHFHVTCPIDLHATVTVELAPGHGKAWGDGRYGKARRAAEETLRYLGCAGIDARLRVESPIPRGKGMASSTADVAAAIGATARALGAALEPAQVGQLAVRVEPSDGLMFAGIARFDHRHGGVVELLGPPPAMWVLALDFGELMDTVAYNAVDRARGLAALESEWRAALDLIRAGVSRGDAVLVGQGATRATLAHGEVVAMPRVRPVLRFAEAMGAVGVNLAHSGTVIGVLFDDPEAAAAARDLARAYLSEVTGTGCYQVIGGGLTTGADEGTDTPLGQGNASIRAVSGRLPGSPRRD
jgi:L-threonine kinase